MSGRGGLAGAALVAVLALVVGCGAPGTPAHSGAAGHCRILASARPSGLEAKLKSAPAAYSRDEAGRVLQAFQTAHDDLAVQYQQACEYDKPVACIEWSRERLVALENALLDHPEYAASVVEQIGYIRTPHPFCSEARADAILAMSVSQKQQLAHISAVRGMDQKEELAAFLQGLDAGSPWPLLYEASWIANGQGEGDLAKKFSEWTRLALPQPDPIMESNLLQLEVEVLATNKRLQPALELLEMALREAPNPRNKSDLLLTRASFHARYDRPGEAEKDLREGLQLRSELLPSYSPQLMATRGRLAVAMGDKGNWDEAVALHVKNLEAQRIFYGELHPLAQVSMSNIAVMYSRQGRLNDALSIHEHIVGLLESERERNYFTLAVNFESMGVLYAKMGERRLSEQVSKRAAEEAKAGIADRKLANRFLLSWGYALLRLDELDAAQRQGEIFQQQVRDYVEAGHPYYEDVEHFLQRVAERRQYLATLKAGDAVVPPALPGGATGQLDSNLILTEIRRYTGDFKRCYDQALRRDDSLEGRLVLRFIITTHGDVGFVGVQANANSIDNLRDTELSRCSQALALQFKFPEPQGGPVWVVYPMVFTKQASEQGSTPSPARKKAPSVGAGEVKG